MTDVPVLLMSPAFATTATFSLWGRGYPQRSAHALSHFAHARAVVDQRRAQRRPVVGTSPHDAPTSLVRTRRLSSESVHEATPATGDLAEALGAASGINPRRETLSLLDLAAVGLTVTCWRNTRLEDLHASEEGPGDALMLVMSVDATRIIRGQIFPPTTTDWEALADSVCRLDRTLPDGRILSNVIGSEFNDLRQDILAKFAAARALTEERGTLEAMMQFAFTGAVLGRGWWGTPWWESCATVFLEWIDDPTSSARSRGADPDEPPPIQRSALGSLLKLTPQFLPLEAIDWCLARGLGETATPGYERWLEKRSR